MTTVASEGTDSLPGGRQKKSDNYRLTLLMLWFVALALAVLSLMSGSIHLSPTEVLQAFFPNTTHTTAYEVIWNLRLPRTLLALLVGLQFAIAGLILQCVTRNPLADPSIIGISSGSSLAIVTVLLLVDYVNAMFLFNTPVKISLEWLPFAAFIGGAISTLFVVLLSIKSNLRPVTLTLNGFAVGAMTNAIVMWLVIVWGGGRTETTVLWLAGSLYARDFSHIMLVLPWTLLGLLLLPLLKSPMSLLRFNEQQAKALGMNVMAWRIACIAVAVIFAASAISVSGPIGFLGLIVPHISRLLVGGDIKRQFWVCALIGASLTLAADLVARTIVSPIELPAGAITTLLGIPVLLFLLQKQVRHQS
ncbi:FecCD family ABC transporter permease [Grimontia sp. NTOU-MAR1]|uniref:FecCD family ABC transporter permease n=1 Tax=Grimontia sp. NTOU-MAR1 TaxID=3111011 RepID=UPI002DBDB662|nr:iron ABC transporter permease [Grimontia sp. NTOU-MAR1]WRV98148.1 iron ABC transporter permease [Grimontia sp. NTOU-MAR1]